MADAWRALLILTASWEAAASLHASGLWQTLGVFGAVCCALLALAPWRGDE